MINKNKITLILSFVITLLLITIGLSFAYFTANITNTEDSTTIYASGGVMNIHYDGGENINVPNIFPSNEPFATKNFTLTGKSTTSDNMNYHIMLVIQENTFTNYALQYKLISTNNDNNGEVASSINQTGINTGSREIFLGNGSFESPANNKLHSYSLDLYFPDTIEDQNEDMDKTFKAFVQIRPEEYICEECLNHKILAQYGGKENITEAPEGLFEQISTPEENAMYKMEDDYGMSYYYRGAKDYVHNNLIFAEHQWKIIRINGDGSIRIIYNGVCPNNDCEINDIGEDTIMGISVFNTVRNDNKYVGYMYGSEEVPTTSYETAHANEVDSTIKTFLDNWYEENFNNTQYETYLADNIYCQDRTLYTGDGYGNINTEYVIRFRLDFNKIPKIKCLHTKDAFTVNKGGKGNGALVYPIGMLTADETSLAGMEAGIANSTNFLYSNTLFFLLAPYRYNYNNGYASLWTISSTGYFGGHPADLSLGVRGVLNLTPDTKVSGSGSIDDPFIVI